MEQRSIRSTEEEGIHSLFDFNEDEIEVCEILLNFANLVVKSELRIHPQPFLVKWGTRKRLACRGGTMRVFTSPSPPNNLATTTTTTTPSKTPSPLPPLQSCTISQQEVKVVGASSPNTPLSFSSSSSSTTTTSTESDDKSSHRKTSKKRETEELKRSMEGLAESREVLIKNVENVKTYYNELLAYNAKLKAKKQQFLCTNTCHSREVPSLEVNKSMNIGSNCGRSYQIGGIPNQNQYTVEQIAMESPSAEQLQFHYPHGHGQVQVRPNLFSSSSGLGKVNHMGPANIPDLNVATECTSGVASSQPWEHSRVIADNNRTKAAEARRNRKMMINQQKSLLKLKFKCVSGTGVMKPPFRR